MCSAISLTKLIVEFDFQIMNKIFKDIRESNIRLKHFTLSSRFFYALFYKCAVIIFGKLIYRYLYCDLIKQSYSMNIKRNSQQELTPNFLYKLVNSIISNVD